MILYLNSSLCISNKIYVKFKTTLHIKPNQVQSRLILYNKFLLVKKSLLKSNKREYLLNDKTISFLWLIAALKKVYLKVSKDALLRDIFGNKVYCFLNSCNFLSLFIWNFSIKFFFKRHN